MYRTHASANCTHCSNHRRDPGNKQRRRILNAGDDNVSAMSTGRQANRKKVVRKSLGHFTLLTGSVDSVNTNSFTLSKAIGKDLLAKDHKTFYISPFTINSEEAQLELLTHFGFVSDRKMLIVGLDLEWSGESPHVTCALQHLRCDPLHVTGPKYPKRGKKKGKIYDASVLVLSNFRATLIINLYQFQDFNSDAVHWPGPYLPRVLDKGYWVADKKGTHGCKWVLPPALTAFFAQKNLCVTGRSINGDLTRLNNVFFGPDSPNLIKVVKIRMHGMLVMHATRCTDDHMHVPGQNTGCAGYRQIRTLPQQQTKNEGEQSWCVVEVGNRFGVAR